MTYYTITTQIKGMTKSDQGCNFVKSNSGKLDGHMMFRIHQLRYHFQFDPCEVTKETRIQLKPNKETVFKCYKLKYGLMINLNLN